jgi:alkylresorcinol/alkylpyrone synthase/polyketide synthase Type III
MRYDVDEEQQRYKFLLSKRIPNAVGEGVVEPVMELLKRHGLHTTDVNHWVVHSGGAAVIAGVTKNLNLSDRALRHTVSVLRDYGNLSSTSVLVSLERLLEEHKLKSNVIQQGDIVIMIGMGPGATIEVALGTFA